MSVAGLRGSQRLFLKSTYVTDMLGNLAWVHSGLGMHSFLESTKRAQRQEWKFLRRENQAPEELQERGVDLVSSLPHMPQCLHGFREKINTSHDDTQE